MARKELTRMRFEEIERLIGLGLSDRSIARALKCSRNTIRKIRGKEQISPDIKNRLQGPLWMEMLNWEEIEKDFDLGMPLKFIWQEKAEDKITYVNFWKQFYKRYPEKQQLGSTHREFSAGEKCEVDYAGSKIPWYDPRTNTMHDAVVFIGILCFSQYMFAEARTDAKQQNFLECHRSMYEYFGGVPLATIPDCAKTAVTSCHLYDPDINRQYFEMAKHYGTAIVPARARHPKDKALVEGAVNIFMRYFRWKFRGRIFNSISEINAAIREALSDINNKVHTRFKISRMERFNSIEKNKLRELPITPFEFIDSKIAKVHPDCHISVEGNFYSVPYIYRGKEVLVRLGTSRIEIFSDTERIAIHNKYCHRQGKYVTSLDHLPDNSKAYYEATPRNILSQAKFISQDLYNLIDKMFTDDTIGNIRKAQGLIRTGRQELAEVGTEQGRKNIAHACETMTLYKKIRVPYFKELLQQCRKTKIESEDRIITRKEGNPFLRYKTGGNQDEYSNDKEHDGGNETLWNVAKP